MWGLKDRVKGCWIVELILEHYMSEEGGYPRIRGKEAKGFKELQVGRIGWGKRIMRSKGNFQQEVTYYLRIKWWTTALLTALMRKWPEQCKSQLSNSFYHLPQMFKRIGVARRTLVGKERWSGCEVEGVYKKKKGS